MLVCMVGCDGGNQMAPMGDDGAGNTGSSGRQPLPKDAGPEDAAMVEEGDAGPVVCISEEFELSADVVARYRPVSILADEDGFAVAWDQGEGRDAMRRSHVPQHGSPEQSSYIDVNDVTDANYQVPVIVHGMVAFKSDLGSLEFRELMAQPLDASLEPVGDVVRITNDDIEPSAPVLVAMDSGFVLVYTQPAGDGSVVVARSLDRAGKPGKAHELATSAGVIAGVSATGLASHALVGWVDPAVDGGEAWVQRIEADGAPSGKAELISTEGNATGRIWLASDDAAALAVFEVLVSGWRRDIRTRLINLGGTAERPEEILAFGATGMAGVSAAAFGGGFAVAYRALQDEVRETRVSFVHGSTGKTVSTVKAGTTTITTETTALAVGPDGTLLVAWSDIPPNVGAVVDDVGAVIKASRITCPEAWLRCSKR